MLHENGIESSNMIAISLMFKNLRFILVLICYYVIKLIFIIFMLNLQIITLSLLVLTSIC
jgi:hypothetical protein